jgi:hypothetical protein
MWAVMQTIGLLTMTVVDLDVNRYLSRNPYRLVPLLAVWALYYAAYSFSGTAYSCVVPLLPFIYLGARFRPVIRMERGFPRITELFTLILALDIIGTFGFYDFQVYNVESQNKPVWPSVVTAIFSVMCAVVIMFCHQWSQQRGESLSVSFNVVIYMYLFLISIYYMIGEY